MPTNTDATLQQLKDLLHSYRFTVGNESELQASIEKVLSAASIGFEREKRLSKSDRPDFLISDIAVEVKVDGSWSAVARQLMRYAALNSISGILLVTTCSRHTRIPTTLNDKPVKVMVLWPL